MKIEYRVTINHEYYHKLFLYLLTAKDIPFRIRFASDNWEYNNAGATAADEGGSTGVTKQAGFKLR